MAEPTEQPEAGERDLLHTLRGVVNRMDPVPQAVEEAARVSYTWRTIDADLADLAYDSLLDEDRLAGVRGDDGPRTLSFEGPTFGVELEVTEEGPRRRLVGQVVPPDQADIEVRHSGGLLRVTADHVGRFAAEGVVPGPVSLRVKVAEGEAPVLETAWVTI